MASITVTPAQVRPIDAHVQCIIHSADAGGSGNAGDAVYLDTSGEWQLADADAEATAMVRGIVASIGNQGYTAFTAGDRLDVVTFGLVFLGDDAGMTIGSNALVYNSVTPGDIDQSAPALSGDFPFTIGWAFAADILFVDPQKTIPTANA